MKEIKDMTSEELELLKKEIAKTEAVLEKLNKEIAKKVFILNEFRYTIGKKNYISMYSTETEEMLFRCPAQEILDATGGQVGVKGYRMIEGEELAEVQEWIEKIMNGKL